MRERKTGRMMVAILLFIGLFHLAVFPQAPGGTIVEAITDPSTLSAYDMTRWPEWRAARLVYETLVVMNRELEITGLLAESWESSDDATKWTIHLREGIAFHDGTPLDASAVVFNLERHLTGAHAWRLGEPESILAVDERTVVLEFAEPTPLLIHNLTNEIEIASPTAVEAAGRDYGSTGIVGTGPFRFVNWVSAQEIVLERNENYSHGPEFVSNTGPAYAERYVLRIIPEDVTRLWELQAGNVDLTQFITGPQLEELALDPKITVETLPSPNIVQVAINTRRAPFDDVLVRRAANHAVDREAVINIAMGGAAEPAYHLGAPTMVGYWEDGADFTREMAYYSPDKARELLEEAGWVDISGDGVREKDGVRLSFDFLTFPFARPRTVAEATTEMLRQVGFDPRIRVLDAADLYDRVSRGQHQLMSTAIGGATDIGFYARCLASSVLGTRMAWYNVDSPYLDSLLDTYFSSTDPEIRLNAAYEMQKWTVEEAIVIAIGVPFDIVAYKHERLGGVDNWLEHPWALQDFRVPLALEVYVK